MGAELSKMIYYNKICFELKKCINEKNIHNIKDNKILSNHDI